jgi:cellulose synthase (UDP-forming)
MRWARGMIQIFRTDNPLFGRGLKLGQRICYLNAMMYFLFPVPRFVFLTAPIAYLLTSQNIIVASALMVMVYAGPHLFHTLGTQSRLDGKYRYSFWGEIYDNVLLFHIMIPTLLALINPKAGSFNVTSKGGILESELYDTRVMRPLMILVMLLITAVGVGIYRLSFTELFPGDANVLLMNLFWCCYSAFTVAAALAVGREPRQVRTAPRIRVRQPVALYFDGRRSLMGRTEDLSLGGGMLRMDDVAAELMADEQVLINFEQIEGISSVPARIITVRGREVRIEFKPTSLDEERTIVSAVFGRADAWLNWDDRPPDSLGKAMADLMRAIRTLAGMASRRRRPPPVGRESPSPVPAPARPT